MAHYNLTILLGREARIFFKAGANCGGYFSVKKLLEQVGHAIDVFEGKTRGEDVQGLLFDNSPSHQKRALDALSARKMPKSIFLFSPGIITSAWLIICLADPKAGRAPFKDAPRMCHGTNPRLESHSHFTSLMITPPCQDGLKGWSKLYRRMDFGQCQWERAGN